MIQRTGNSKIAVVGWGRGMGHKGHMYLASSVITQAAKMKADPYFFVSKTVGKDDPIFPEEKVKIYQKVFPQQAPIFQPQGNLNQALTELAQGGYQGVVLVVGADQKDAFKYLERPNKEGVPVYQSMGLQKLRVISRQETGDSSAGLEGPRATPMREVLLHPEATEEQKFKIWRDAMPDALSDKEVMDLMKKAEARLMGSFKKKSVKEATSNPLDDDDAFGYMKYFKQPEKKQPEKEQTFRGWDHYYNEKNKEQKQPNEVEESRIMDRNALINAFYVSPEGKKHRVAERIPYYLLDKLVGLLTKKYNITMNDIEVRPADQSQYRRSSQPELAESRYFDGKFSGTQRLALGRVKNFRGQTGNLVLYKHNGTNRMYENPLEHDIELLVKDPGTGRVVLDLYSGTDEQKAWELFKEYNISKTTRRTSQLDEFAPDEGGGSRKFIPWPEFIEQLKQIVGKNFDCKESIVKTTIKARFVPHDPMEFGPTMLYSYYETRAGRKGAHSTRGAIQVGKYTGGGFTGQIEGKLLTTFSLLKGHPFERHFDLTFENIYKIANIIQGNTQGALEFKPELTESLANPNEVAELLYKVKPEIFTRFGDDFVMDAIEQACQEQSGTAQEVAGKVVEILRQGLNEAGFDREAFRRQMADLEAREELRKTDPVAAKALDLRGQLPQQTKKKPEDDSMSINDPRHPGAAYTQGNKLDEFAPNGFDGFDDDRVPMHFIVEKDRYNRRSKWKKSYKPEGGGIALFTTKQEAIQAAEKYNKIDPNREFKYGGTQMVDPVEDNDDYLDE